MPKIGLYPDSKLSCLSIIQSQENRLSHRPISSAIGTGGLDFLIANALLILCHSLFKVVITNVLKEAGVSCTLAAVWPEGVTVAERRGERGRSLWFVQNFNRYQVRVSLEAAYQNAETGERTGKILEMPAFSCVVLEECR